MSSVAALLWMIVAALAGMAPQHLHHRIAYGLMLAFLPVAGFLAWQSGALPVLGFFAIALFQLRLLLISWGAKLYRWIQK